MIYTGTDENINELELDLRFVHLHAPKNDCQGPYIYVYLFKGLAIYINVLDTINV